MALPLFAQDESTVHITYDLDSVKGESMYNTTTFPEHINKRYSGVEFNYKEKLNKEVATNTGTSLFSFINPNIFTSFISVIIYIILPLLLIVLVIIGVYHLFLYLKHKGNKGLLKKEEDSLISTEEVIENIHEIDFEKQIAYALENKAYTHAIRWSYLYNLKIMDDKKIINWQPKKTNQDYYYEINQTTLKEDFKYLTYVYDNLWFGKFKIESQQANHILDRFTAFKLNLIQQ